MVRADLSSAAQTRSLGLSLAKLLHQPALITLRGELGSGKTSLVRETLRALGVDEVIASPSYTIAQSYQTRDGLLVNHLDLYRINESIDVDLLAWDDYLGHGLTFVEWPEAGTGQLPPATLDIELKHVTPTSREARLRGVPEIERELVKTMIAAGISAKRNHEAPV